MSAPETPRTARVIVASTSAAAGEATDRTGPVIVAWLRERGFETPDPVVVADGGPVAEAVTRALAEGADAVLTTGGTGISPSDATPEAVDPLLDVRLPGLIEELRRRGTAAGLPNAALTRGVAGFAGSAFVMTFPGSPGGVRDGLAVLDPLLEHLLDQRSGSPRGSHGAR
ncbi:molybdenum cofactor biosynthesis protein [Leucobacter sp. OLJS4]|uniref:MogA/MoaB family molybdenum cofactor biosynthesis protein n=1 Tax=unclassified Leucobacter TaxID=2621730 RepID=UPI000C183135|nr:MULTISPECIES: MogA/MoaB family molybdenum cofactor biosynthesis protein [unclassified Leucobacter]PII85290.1 molybdenum cofactor biosynthesis protein [Leucobacter sp. OLCALW19]PII93070.1 molybdenum cofactor biosynthesis protein [Leucobacter sp. OLAS13]PII95942.1 molybdenum cofactor biosynthesis protein [Leucobacter sp. OLTLW20]PII99258.1 molybdenum cofactor biosynthesis protein [Leucobacter sp. OLDS2]PIJ01259.1 molybdenum cofactor biosynthesis protein [Leucobacter sp. OLIS6]